VEKGLAIGCWAAGLKKCGGGLPCFPCSFVEVLCVAAGFAAGVWVLGGVGEGLEGANKLNSLLRVNC